MVHSEVKFYLLQDGCIYMDQVLGASKGLKGALGLGLGLVACRFRHFWSKGEA